MTTAFPVPTRKSNYRKIFEAALRMSASEQRQLRDELARLAEVRLVPPAAPRQEAQKLADEVRAELAKTETSATLDETMQQLRGRA